MCRICVSLGLVRSIPESRFLVLFLACVFSLNPIFELLLGRGHTKRIPQNHIKLMVIVVHPNVAVANPLRALLPATFSVSRKNIRKRILYT